MLEGDVMESLKNLKSALGKYIEAFTVNGKYVGNPEYLEDYENICMFLEGGEYNGRSEREKRKA